MSQTLWTQKDFHVFQIEGLDERMQALTEIIRPKFHTLGQEFSTYFSVKTGLEFFPHVAKHARRTVNPPKDSWVAFAPYKRGYKAIPHFQIGLWGTHLFIVLAVIYEAPNKVKIAERLLKQMDLFKSLPNDFVLSGDHMSPEAVRLEEIREEGVSNLLVRLRDVKKGEFLVGRHITQEDATQLSQEQFMKIAEETFDLLVTIYNIMTSE